MPIALKALMKELDLLLGCERISDYCPNGLQVEGRAEVRRIVSGVTASQALLDAAVQQGADLVLVHHGYFWKNENPCVTGMKQRRLKTLLAHDISLAAYHLPLDMHPELGNNVQLGLRLGLRVEEPLEPGNSRSIGVIGHLPQPLPAGEFAARVAAVLGREPLLVDRDAPVQRIAWCTGGAQGYIEQAIAAGADLYLTGEVSEATVHAARENDIAFIAAGHHATERYGVQALGDWIASRFDIEHQFIECANPA